MKISKQSMIKMGFKQYDEIWQHRSCPFLQYRDPSWAGLVNDIYSKGYHKGYSQGEKEIQAAIRKALDIR
jgi:hypothetical protein